ncbi:MAG: hypothetical protein FWF72_01565, partial [Paludibacter sp.]|nr:hypothetical protein [Paludibacter sp.]
MKKITIPITAGLFICASLFAQTPTPPPTIMTNLGLFKVAVSATDTAILFVDGTVKAKDVSAIDLDGKMIITGNFIQDATRPAFVSAEYENANSTGINDKVSTGIFVFRGDFASGKRVHQITTDDNSTAHNRGIQYLAFPNIRLETNDTVVVTSFMGIDAKTIDTIGGKTGRLLLRSENIGGKVYDASLRFPYDGSAAAAGKIAIERNVELYRTNQANQLYAFASPFTNQRSGYFAGNWVRNPIDVNGYVLHPLANAMDNNGHIFPEYYVTDPFEQLLPGQPYLIRYQNSSYTYDTEQDLLWTSSMSGQNTKGTYLFNGYPYNLSSIRGYIPEQILTNEALYDHTLGSVTSAKYIIVGNSYSAPISVEKLIAYLGSLSPALRFQKYLYFFPAGSQTYTQMDMSASDVNAFPTKYIPSQSIFMVLQSGGTGGRLKFDKSLTVQAKVTNNLVANAGGAGIYGAPAMIGAGEDYMPNLLRFRVTPDDDNKYVYDQTAIFVRTDASAGNDRYDMQKFTNPDEGSFLLAMKDDANVRQLQMGVPTTTASAKMLFRPSKYAGDFILTASNVESMTTQAVILEDTKTNTFQDLRENPVYKFGAEQYDNE